MHTMTALRLILVLGVTSCLLLLATQVRKPGKWAGLPIVWLMNLSHSRLTDWGLQNAHIQSHFTILDVGCGGGRTIQKLATAAASGKVYGIDYAQGSIAASRARNAELIRAGLVEITPAAVSHLPFPDNNFDLVTAVETQYYWPDLQNDMREILRVLKPGGMLLVIAESFRKGNNNKLQGSAMNLLGATNLSAEDQRKLFSDAGFAEIMVHVENRKGWICAMGSKRRP